MPVRRLAVAAIAALVLVAAAPLGGPGSAPEPDGLFTGPLQSYTPSTLKGATVVDAEGVAALAAKNAVLIDVGAADRKPAGLPETAVWRPQHRSIPGAVWFPGSAPADLPAEAEATLKARIATLTAGDLERPIVTFCQPDCWGSWNMGKRLVIWGYRNVNWYPRGVNGWQESDRPTSVVSADPDWIAASKPREKP